MSCTTSTSLLFMILPRLIIVTALLCCRQDMLKKRLTRDFPQLVFHMPLVRNICELVFVETLSTRTLVDMLPYPSGAETTQSSELSQTDSETEKGTTERQTTQEDARTLYTAALFLKRHLSDTPGMSCPW